jgi:hypothetical protein
LGFSTDIDMRIVRYGVTIVGIVAGAVVVSRSEEVVLWCRGCILERDKLDNEVS